MILLDTCALIYWTIDPGKLTKKVKDTIDKESLLCISSISIWEIGIKTAKGKLVIPLSLGDFVERLKKIDRLEIVPVDEKIWLENLRLDWSHKDPADRTIVATAKLNSCRLITSDNVIAGFYDQTVW